MSPDGRVSLVQNSGQESRQKGWDLTFSAPKPVSVLWSQAPPDARRVIQEAQQGAVDAALKYLEYTAALIDDAVRRHGRGDWGEIGVDDMQANDMRATEGGTIASIYTSSTGIKFYVLTEADRSVTTVLLPEEY